MNRPHHGTRSARLVVALIAVLALWLVGCEREITGNVETADTVSDQCFGCHNGQMDAMQGEWANSVHASGANVDYTSRPAPFDCTKCHNQEGFIDQVSTGTVNPPYENAKGIGCFACHNPHETGSFELRTVEAVTLPSGDIFDHGLGNLCVQCHQARRTADTITDDFQITSSHWGPHHGNQSDVLQGVNGYENLPGFSGAQSHHRSVVENACVGCHMANEQIHDGYEVGGHSFNMLEPDGSSLAPTCLNASCHGGGSLEFADPTTEHPFDFTLVTGAIDHDHDGIVEGYQTEMMGLADSLKTLLVVQGILDGDGHPVRGTYADGRLAGAAWNYIVFEEDRSHGIHNFGYTRALLQASIDFVATLP